MRHAGRQFRITTSPWMSGAPQFRATVRFVRGEDWLPFGLGPCPIGPQSVAGEADRPGAAGGSCLLARRCLRSLWSMGRASRGFVIRRQRPAAAVHFGALSLHKQRICSEIIAAWTVADPWHRAPHRYSARLERGLDLLGRVLVHTWAWFSYSPGFGGRDMAVDLVVRPIRSST